MQHYHKGHIKHLLPHTRNITDHAMGDFCKYFFDKGLCNFDQIVERFRANPETSPSEIMRTAVYPSIRIAFEEMYNGHLGDVHG